MKYTRIDIKSADNLPKKESIYIVKCADNDTPEFMKLAKKGNAFWNKVAWYLIEDTEPSYPEEFVEWLGYYHILRYVSQTNKKDWKTTAELYEYWLNEIKNK